MTAWSEKELGDVLTLNYGWSLPEKNRAAGDVPVFGSNGIVGSHNKALVPSVGLIVGRKGSAGNVHLSRRPFCPIDTTFFIAPSDTALDIEFLYYLLLHVDLKRILGDVGVPGLNREMAYRERTQFPNDTAEQRKIAGVLGLVQQAMEQQERLLALTAELKKALLHQLFTAGLRSEPQKQTDLGLVPESWEVEPLGDYLTEAQYGISAKGGATGRYAVLRMTNQKQGRITSDKLQFVDLDERQFVKFRVERRDILFNRTNSLELVGRTALFDLEGDFVFASYLIRLRTDADRLRPEFLNHYFNSEETQVRLKSIATRAVSQSNISATRLRGFPVPVPPIDEQDELIASLDAVKTKAEVHRRKHATLTALFRTLLHLLMTAQIRVHDLSLDDL